MVGYIFGGNTGISSPQELERRRAIADMLATGASRAPKDVGEGLTAIGQALAFRLMDRKNRKDAETGRAQGDKAFANLFSMFGGGGQQDTQAPEMAGGTAVSPSSAPPQQMDYPTQRVAQAFGDENAPKPMNLSGNKQAFIEALLPAAIEESRRTGVDPRIIVAQAAQETGWGKSAPGNNFFGIKSHGKGGGQNLTTHEVINGQRVKINDSFRTFNSPADSVRGYGDFILQNPRYKGMREAQGLDAQLQALGASGYATDPNYANSVGAIARGIQMPEGPMPMPTMPLGPGAPQQAPEMAGAPVQVAQAGGEFPPPPQAPQGGQNGNRLQMLMQAAQNPWLSADQKRMVDMMLQQEMAKMDPNAGLDAEYKRMQINKLESDIATANSPDARKKFGLNPQYGVDAQGNPVLLQLGEDGSAQQTQLPPGVSLSKEPMKIDAGTHWILINPITQQPMGQIAKNVAGEAAASETGKAQGQAQAGLGNAEAGYNTAVEQIDAILNHPGLDSSVGTIQGRIPDALAGAMNSDVADFRTRVGQLQGQTFLRAFEALKGGGAITEIEGKKAEQAIGRLNQAVSESDFKAALSDLRTILDRGMDAYRRKAGVVAQPADGWQDMGGGVRMRVKQ